MRPDETVWEAKLGNLNPASGLSAALYIGEGGGSMAVSQLKGRTDRWLGKREICPVLPASFGFICQLVNTQICLRSAHFRRTLQASIFSSDPLSSHPIGSRRKRCEAPHRSGADVLRTVQLTTDVRSRGGHDDTCKLKKKKNTLFHRFNCCL